MPIEKIPNSPTPDIKSLFEKIKEAGFPLVGAVDLDLAKEAFTAHADRYSEWIAAGFHGEMGYLERGLPRRLDPTLVFPETKAIIACAIPYRRNPETPTDPALPRYARYLEGPDYHKYIPTLLTTALEKWVVEGHTAKWKICVDTSAVLERSWAALTGLGWIGKNTLLIHPKLGSYLFLATILIDRKTGIAPNPLPNYCGNCNACLEGCPTKAFERPGILDARKCISYLTLEKRGDWDPNIEREKSGTWIAGCDICQEVCPYNRKPAHFEETWPKDFRDTALVSDWDILQNESEEMYRIRIKDSALSRIKFFEMKRNLQNAKSNRKIEI